jgi:hypothetical protein
VGFRAGFGQHPPRVGAYRYFHEIYPTHASSAPTFLGSFKRSPADIRYYYRGKRSSIIPVTGRLIVSPVEGGRARHLCPGTSDLNFFCDVERVVYLNAQIPNRTFDLRMPQK